jgi:hypothetical protein
MTNFYRLISFNNQDLDRYERVEQATCSVPDHRCVINAQGKEFIIHDRDFLDPSRRVLELRQYHMQQEK